MKDSSIPNYEPYQKLPWGEEVSRLPPASSVLIPNVGKEIALNPDPSTKIEFARQPFPSQAKTISPERTLLGDCLLNKIILSPDDTKAITLACAKAKCSATVLLNSILLLADVEQTLTVLQTDANNQNSPSSSALIEENWQKSEVWCIPANPVDMRSYMYPRYQTAHGQCTSGGIVNLMIPSYHSMDAIRSCLSFRDGKVHRAWYENPTAFWGELLPNTGGLLKVIAKQPPSKYHESIDLAEQVSSMLGTPGLEALLPKPAGIIPSSIGSMERLGLYRDFSPLAQKAKMGTSEEPPFVLPEMGVNLRSHNTPCIVMCIYEYNGSLVVTVQGSKSHQTAEGWEVFGQSVGDGLKHIAESVRTFESRRSEATRAVL
ncbi:hypothetical protein D9758_004504 [Tetrapyrgos nigripes]|uniref:Uncharacterized protein n=1 Tax=Tetrapyrgos nigripes TaxID=182062 RepID=A0A8H5LSQ4_9AGAR|nr:hypothetical protein D9758_004504 [Tetrapyrgos nigripes]